MTRKTKSCDNCGYLGHDKSECWYGDYETASMKTIRYAVIWIIALAILAYVLFACSPATPIYGHHDCGVSGYHKHMADTAGGYK